MPRLCKGKDNDVKCRRQAYFGAVGDAKPDFCSTHKALGMVDLHNKKCLYPECTTKPHYGYPGGKPEYCSAHQAEGMENLRSKRCAHQGCERFASCGMEGQKPMFCSNHMLTGMKNLIGRKCTFEGCGTFASYGLPVVAGARARPLFCSVHKDVGMVNVTKKGKSSSGRGPGRPKSAAAPVGKPTECQEEGCEEAPKCGFPADGLGLRCSEHKLEGMEDLQALRCRYKRCKRQPQYGVPGGAPLVCTSHKVPTLVNLMAAAYRCRKRKCTRQCRYGMSNQGPRFCIEHKKKGMVDVYTPTCVGADCEQAACYGYPGEIASCCFVHCAEGMEVQDANANQPGADMDIETLLGVGKAGHSALSESSTDTDADTDDEEAEKPPAKKPKRTQKPRSRGKRKAATDA